jgi:hypothetical protein
MQLNPAGIFNHGYNPSTLQARSFATSIIKYNPQGAPPLLSMSAYFSKPEKPVMDTSYGYYMMQFPWVSLVIDEANDYGAGDTTLTVDSTAGVVPNMVFQTPAREIIRVATVVDSTTVTVERGFGRVAAAAILDDAVLFNIGNALAEASVRPVARSYKPQYVPNYTSIFRNAWALTNSAAASLVEQKLYDNVGENRRQCGEFHASSWELTALFSQPKAPTGDPPLHTTQGVLDAIYQYAPNNIITAQSTTSWQQLRTAFEVMFSRANSMSNSNVRVGLCNGTAISIITDIVENTPYTANVSMDTNVMGMHITTIRTAHGTTKLVEDAVMNGVLPSDKGTVIGIDPNVLQVGYLGNRDAISENLDGTKDAKGDGIDAQTGSLTTEMVVLNRVPDACMVLNNLTAAATP